MTREQLKSMIKRRNKKELLKAGFRMWDAPKAGRQLLLIPGEYYPLLWSELVVFNLDYSPELFIPGKTDNDMRFGMLPYGITVAC